MPPLDLQRGAVLRVCAAFGIPVATIKLKSVPGGIAYREIGLDTAVERALLVPTSDLMPRCSQPACKRIERTLGIEPVAGGSEPILGAIDNAQPRGAVRARALAGKRAAV